jgi:hypothetical protein
MTGQCCQAGRAGASIVPAVLLLLLPKCPACLGVWLTVATGISFSAAGAAWVRGSLALFWIAALAVMFWRRAFKRRLAG